MLKLKQFRVLSYADATSQLLGEGIFSPAKVQLSTIGVNAEQVSCSGLHSHTANTQVKSSLFTDLKFSAASYSASSFSASTNLSAQSNNLSSQSTNSSVHTLQAKRNALQSLLNVAQALGVSSVEGYKKEYHAFSYPDTFSDPAHSSIRNNSAPHTSTQHTRAAHVNREDFTYRVESANSFACQESRLCQESGLPKQTIFQELTPYKQEAALVLPRTSIELSNYGRQSVCKLQGLKGQQDHVWLIEDRGAPQAHKFTKQANNQSCAGSTTNLEHGVPLELKALKYFTDTSSTSSVSYTGKENQSQQVNQDHMIDSGHTAHADNVTNTSYTANASNTVKVEHPTLVFSTNHLSNVDHTHNVTTVYHANHEEQAPNAYANNEINVAQAKWKDVISDFRSKSRSFSPSFTQAFNRSTQGRIQSQESFQAHEVLAEQSNIHLMDRDEHQSYTATSIEQEAEGWIVNLEALPAFSRKTPCLGTHLASTMSETTRATLSNSAQHSLSKYSNYAYLSHLEHSFAVLHDLDSTLEQDLSQYYQVINQRYHGAKQKLKVKNTSANTATNMAAQQLKPTADNLGHGKASNCVHIQISNLVHSKESNCEQNNTAHTELAGNSGLASTSELVEYFDIQHISFKSTGLETTKQHSAVKITNVKSSNLEQHSKSTHKSEDASKYAAESFEARAEGIDAGQVTDCKLDNFENASSFLKPTFTQEALFSRTYQRVESLKQLLRKVADSKVAKNQVTGNKFDGSSKVESSRQYRELNTAQSEVKLAAAMHINQLEVQNDQGLLGNQSSISIKGDGDQNSFDATVLSEGCSAYKKTFQGESLFSAEQGSSQNQVSNSRMALISTPSSSDTVNLHTSTYLQTTNSGYPSFSAFKKVTLAQSYSQAYDVSSQHATPQHSKVVIGELKEGGLGGEEEQGGSTNTDVQDKLNPKTYLDVTQDKLNPNTSSEPANTAQNKEQRILKTDHLNSDKSLNFLNAAQSFIHFEGTPKDQCTPDFTHTLNAVKSFDLSQSSKINTVQVSDATHIIAESLIPIQASALIPAFTSETIYTFEANPESASFKPNLVSAHSFESKPCISKAAVSSTLSAHTLVTYKEPIVTTTFTPVTMSIPHMTASNATCGNISLCEAFKDKDAFTSKPVMSSASVTSVLSVKSQLESSNLELGLDSSVENQIIEFNALCPQFSLADYQHLTLEDPILSQIFYIQHQYQVAFFLPKLHACINEFCSEINSSLLLATQTSFQSAGYFLNMVKHGLMQWGIKTWELMQQLTYHSTAAVPESRLSHKCQAECAAIRRLLSIVIEYELQQVSAYKAQMYRCLLNQN